MMMPRRPDAAAMASAGMSPGVPRVSAGGRRDFRRAAACARAGRAASETGSETDAEAGAEVGAAAAL